jgi:PAS domain S-box-containing protein
MNGNKSDIIQKLNTIVDRLLSGKHKFDFDKNDLVNIEDESIKSLADKVVQLAEQYRDCYGFIMDLARGRLYTESPRINTFANPFKQLHSELRHLTWQIQEIANGDYDQRVSFSGDFSDSINKMIIALRERQMLAELNRENEYLFRSIFSTSPDGIVLCNLNHCIVNASNAAYRMLQLTDEINGKLRFSELVHQEDKEKHKWFTDTLLNGDGITVFAELRLVSQNGENFWSEQNASILYDSNGKPKGYIIIFRDISERKAAEEQLLQYTDELDETNRTKDKLFSIIAHDLRSPFNALLGLSNMLEQEVNNENPNPQRIRNFSKLMYTSTSKSYDLLINLLEWSRLQTNRIEINAEQFDLGDLIINNVEICTTMAMDKDITLEYTTKGDYSLVSDRAIINTILRNLITNAIK